MQACRFAFGKKTQAKKTQAKSKLKQKTPKNSRKSSQNSIYLKFFIQHCIQYFYGRMKGQFSRVFHPKVKDSSENSRMFSTNSMIFAINSRKFSKNSINFTKNSIYRKIYSPMMPFKMQNDKPDLMCIIIIWGRMN